MVFSKPRLQKFIILILITTTILGIKTKIFIILWIFLEINTLAFCIIITINKIKKNSPKPYFVTYLMVQLVRRIIFVLSRQTWLIEYRDFTVFLIILIKIGRWPFHTWYLKFLRELKLKTLPIFLVIRWQKILPLITLQSIFNVDKGYFLIIFAVVTRRTAPLFIIKKTIELKTVLLNSSVNFNSWLIINTIGSWKVTLMILFWYAMGLKLAIRFEKISNTLITRKKDKWELISIICIIGGVPPRPIFFLKFKVITTYFILSGNFLLTFILLVASCFILFFYLNAVSSKLTEKPKKFIKKKNNGYPKLIIILASITTAAVVTNLI